MAGEDIEPPGSYAQDNAYFRTEVWVRDHVSSVDATPLEPVYDLTYLREAIVGCGTVLDVGCCGAQFRELLESVAPRVGYYGVDFSERALQEARRRHDAVRVVEAEASHLPFRGEQFDLSYQRDVMIHHPDPLALLREMYRVGRRVLFNARVSPRIRYPLTLRDRERSVLYQVLPDHALFDALLNLSPPPASVRFKVVEIIGTSPTRFDWNSYPHYRDILGSGEQYHLHCFVVKGDSTSKTRVIDETSSSGLRLHGYRRLTDEVRGGMRRILFRLLGPRRFDAVRSVLRWPR